MTYPAIFLDRDGTLVHPRHYPSRPDELQLYDGIGNELRNLQMAGFKLVVVTNQSGLAHGYFTEDDLELMHEHLVTELDTYGVGLDGIYYCPHHPEGLVQKFSVACECRKPGTGMILTAACDLDIDLGRSWLVGDILDDIEAGNHAACKTILVDLGTELPPVHSIRMPSFIARDTLHALRIIGTVTGIAEGQELDYTPRGWSPRKTGVVHVHKG